MKVIAIGPLYNEGERVVEVMRRFTPGLVDEVVIVDDGSTDGAGQKVAQMGATVLTLPHRNGPGSAIRVGIEYGLKKGYDYFVVFATNGKDNPEEIPRLLAPLIENRADFVQGSRYLEGGGCRNMPFHRLWGVPVYTFFFSLAARRKITDATNGFRAFRRKILENPAMNLTQEWVQGYTLESYLFLKTFRLGYRILEVPITKIYPNSKKGYSKQRPVDWWSFFKPILYLPLRLKK